MKHWVGATAAAITLTDVSPLPGGIRIGTIGSQAGRGHGAG